ncbi:hypothetical protein [Abyssisolibacter fermentans]|uniref:hypothetical protein n=1 Tax=Abyssisolibacter fermentans TaxID=1766203 RepID=UPI00082AB038|nr:hypothetical protein [Abyssisolibacter fermentans]
MKSALTETKFIYNVILSQRYKKGILNVLDEVIENPRTYTLQELWEIDKDIGGIGGYCMPCDPKKNPFPGGEYRKLFRPLQYARSNMEVNNIHINARYVIHSSGMHLEEVLRFMLSKYSIIGRIRYSNTTLGKATNILSKRNKLPNEIVEDLFKFIALYNKSKHEINLDDKRKRLFMASDAIIGYLGARIIGYRILKMIEHDSVFYSYNIDNTKFDSIF